MLEACFHKLVFDFLCSTRQCRDRTSFACEVRMYHGCFIKHPSGDEEIRTLDPLLARQVLSQLSYIPSSKVVRLISFGERPKKLNSSSLRSDSLTFLWSWHQPALPHRLQCSTIGRSGLNRRVRDGNGCVPGPHRHQIYFVTVSYTHLTLPTR